MRKILLFISIIITLLLCAGMTVYAEDLTISDTCLKEAHELMYQAVRNHEEVVDIKQLQIPSIDVTALVNSFMYEYPDVSFVINERSYESVNGIITKIKFTYKESVDLTQPKLEYVDKETDKIALLIQKNWTDLQKIAWINDYICDNYNYDLKTQNHSIYQFLKTRSGVCDAYAALFTILCEKAGVNVSYCYSDDIQHIWNMVEVDGSWYHVDTTWNDDYNDRYEFFMLSDDAQRSAAKNVGYTDIYVTHSLYYGNNKKFDKYFWRDGIYSGFAHMDEYSFYIKDYDVFRVNLYTGSSRKMGTINKEYWSNPKGQHYSDCFADLVRVGSKLLVSMPSGIYTYDIDSGRTILIYNIGDKQQIVSLTLSPDQKLIIGMNGDLDSDNVVYEPLSMYLNLQTVTYMVDNEKYEVHFYYKGDILETIKNPIRKGYEFIKWEYSDGMILEKDVIIDSEWKLTGGVCKVEFIVDDKVIYNKILDYGEKIVPPTDPIKQSDEFNHYVFIQWNGYTPGMTAVDGIMTFVAEFKNIERAYTIKFYNQNGLIQEVKLDAGEKIKYPDIATSYEKDGKTYNFIAWDCNDEVALRNQTITAIFAEEGKVCTISYYVDGKLFHREEVASGSKFVETTKIPEKNSSGKIYTFIEWIGDKPLYVLDDIEFQAQFNTEIAPEGPVVIDPPADQRSPKTIIIIAIVLASIVFVAWFTLFRNKD